MCGGGSGGDEGAAAGRLGDARCLAIRPEAPIMPKLIQGVNLMWCCCAAVVTPDKNFWLLRLTHGSRNSFVSPGKLPLRNELSQICGSVVRQASVSGASDHFRSSPYGLLWSRNLETGGWLLVFPLLLSSHTGASAAANTLTHEASTHNSLLIKSTTDVFLRSTVRRSRFSSRLNTFHFFFSSSLLMPFFA